MIIYFNFLNLISTLSIHRSINFIRFPSMLEMLVLLVRKSKLRNHSTQLLLFRFQGKVVWLLVWILNWLSCSIVRKMLNVRIELLLWQRIQKWKFLSMFILMLGSWSLNHSSTLDLWGLEPLQKPPGTSWIEEILELKSNLLLSSLNKQPWLIFHLMNFTFKLDRKKPLP